MAYTAVMRPAISLTALLALLAAFIFLQRTTTRTTVQAASPNTRAFRLTFGERTSQPRDYSGGISLSSGTIVALRGYRFFRGDEITGPNSWKLAVKRGAFESQPGKPNPLTMQSPPSNILPEGVEVVVDAPETTSVSITTPAARFSFSLATLQNSARLMQADGDITVQEIALNEKISTPEAKEHHDYPSAAVARDGTRWVAWQSYLDNGDMIYAKHATPNGWSQTFRLTDSKTDVYQTAMAEDAKGRVWVTWAERDAGQSDTWNIYGRAHANNSWSPRQRLTESHSPNFSHRLTASRDGVLHLVWIGHENGQSFVYHRKLAGDTWSAVTQVSGPSAWLWRYSPSRTYPAIPDRITCPTA